MIVRSKIKLKKIIDSAKRAEKSVLIKKGVFDIVHPGHIFAIEKFKKIADVVIILAMSDEYIRKKKGNDRPINKQGQRMALLDGIKGVDYVYPDRSVSREGYIKLLEYLRPTILAVTAVDKAKTKEYSRSYWRLKEFPDKNKPGFSTTAIINRVLNSKRNN